MTSTFTISHTIDQTIIDELEVEFDDFRTRIARLSMNTCGTITDMFSPLGPVAELEVIDIDAMEWEQHELEMVPAIRTDAAVLQLTAA